MVYYPSIVDDVLVQLAESHPAQGQYIDREKILIFAPRTLRNIFEDPNEGAFVLEQMVEAGWLLESMVDSGIFYRISLLGWGKVFQARETNRSQNSDKCFVAMSFDRTLEYLYDMAIKPACEESNFKPIRVDREHPGSGETINDAIIAGIRASHFTIADFTQHKNGVYFEAGFALGQGQKVIFTCRRDEFGKAHFDTNHYPHIIYETPEELKKALMDKINAWIKI